MTQSDEIAVSILNFDDSDFFVLDDDRLIDRESELLDIDFTGIAINGPKTVDCKAHSNIPMLFAVQSSGERDWRVGTTENCFLIAADAYDGSVRIGRPFVSPGDRVPFPTKEESDYHKNPPPGLCDKAAQVSLVDVRKIMRLPWKSGKWYFTMILYDWTSNCISIELTGEDPAQPSSNKNVFPEPGKRDKFALPSYVPLILTPALRDSALSFQLILDDQGKLMLMLYASFKLTIRSLHIPKKSLGFYFEKDSAQRVAAVVPISVLLISLNNRFPFKMDLAIPVFGELVHESQSVQGQFALDILETAQIEEYNPGEYLCYIVMEGIVYGPEFFQLPDHLSKK